VEGAKNAKRGNVEKIMACQTIQNHGQKKF
jgi:hypothetical protein